MLARAYDRAAAERENDQLKTRSLARLLQDETHAVLYDLLAGGDALGDPSIAVTGANQDQDFSLALDQ